ncbi:antA/AntB antirepressor family protein [Gallibacterium anatis]|uniref:antA/AntB antirepressor family protein n=1 Tax=Gallibacterium anatis TaxID=750 RepID=UPI002549F942|nr:antA/AntB antirepressor family protein [Gallibacterium anatis]WIM82207.1 antA/AntB antirepressor family protein [Gallibacterium anatis]WIM82280.1 antA/AntB antirepressor family protein [Gallibacterium anatis]
MTNSNLIPVFNGLIANQPVQLCNARELHRFVESKRQYGDWIKDRITDYGFQQNEDYIIVPQRTNGRPRKEYHITLDMGKELAMVERNEKGRMVRKYFIECERRALEQSKQLALPEPQKPKTIEIDTDVLDALIKYCKLAKRHGEQLEPAMRTIYTSLGLERYIKNNFAAQAYDLAHEFNYWIDEAERTYLSQTTPRLR